MLKRKKFLFTCLFLIFFLLTQPGNYFDRVRVFAFADEVPWFLKMNMSLVIDRKAIENFAEEWGWEKTSSLARRETISCYIEEEEPGGKKIFATLWSPTALWVELMKDAELSQDTKEKAEEEYRNHEWLFSMGFLQFTLDLQGDTKEKVSPENLKFILENPEGKKWEAEKNAQITSRGITKKTCPDGDYFKNTLDIFFLPSEDGGNNWGSFENLFLHVVFRDSKQQVTLEWEMALKYCIEEQFEYHFQKMLRESGLEGIFSQALEVLKNNTDITDTLDLSLLTPERFNLRGNLFSIALQGGKDNFVDLFIEVLDYFPEENHFFIQIVKNFISSWNIFAVWEEDERGFRILESDYVPREILPYYLNFKPIYLGENNKGIILDTSFRHRLSYAVLLFDPMEGYRKVWDFEGEGFLYIFEDQPGVIKQHQFSDWDSSFPITQRGYPTSFFPEVLRVKEHTYLWENKDKRFYEVDQQEIFGRVAVINHFLRALLEEDHSVALDFIKKDSSIEQIFKQEASCLPTLLDIGNSDIYIYKIDGLKLGAWDLPDVDFLEKIDYKPPEKPNVIMVMAKQKPQGNKRNSLSPADFSALVIWEFSRGKPWEISGFRFFSF